MYLQIKQQAFCSVFGCCVLFQPHKQGCKSAKMTGIGTYYTPMESQAHEQENYTSTVNIAVPNLH